MEFLQHQALSSEIIACTRCPARELTNQPIPGEGPRDAILVFLGRNPGIDEETAHRPFVGPGGKLLNKMIEALGFSREKVGIVNSMRCHTPGDAQPKKSELEACYHWTVQEINFFTDAKLYVPLGNDAMRVMMGFDRPSILEDPLKIYRVSRGVFAGKYVAPLLHPGFLLRKPSWLTWTFETALPALKLHIETHILGVSLDV